MLARGNGAAAIPRVPRWSPAELVPLVMLPVLIWLGLDILHITPRASQPHVKQNPGITFGQNRSTQEPAPPPPPPELLYWQKALMAANATGLPHPVFRGNWMEAAEARLRWFEFDGTARQMRPPTWWAYEDPAPKDPQDSKGGGTDSSGRRRRRRQRKLHAADSGSKGANDSWQLGVNAQAASLAAGRVSGVGTSSSEQQRRRMQEDERKAEAWARRGPPLQERGPLPEGSTAAEERSYYLPWIKRDLDPWRKHGITEADLKRAELLAGDQGPYCFGDQFLFQIVGGRLYVQFQTTNRKQEGVQTRQSSGWFPGNMGAGLAVAKGHVPYALFMLLDVLRAFPGQVPDVSAVIHTSDFPCIKEHRDVPDTEWRDKKQELPEEHYNGRPIPILGYNRKDGFMDLMFPDFTHFGHEYSQVTDPTGRMLNGLPQQFDVIVATHGCTPLEQRRPKVMWRGRASDEPRDAVRKHFQGCPAKLEKQGHKGAAELFDVVAPPLGAITAVTLKSNGLFRYPVYIDAGAYSSSLKQKLVAGSAMLTIEHEYHEWYTRALQPGYTHITVDDGPNMCEDVFKKVTLMEEMVKEQAAAVTKANHAPPWLQPHADTWYQHPWGVNHGVISDEELFKQLRDWTLAQRGIAVAGVNAYEDSELYLAPPPPLPDSDADLAADLLAADGDGGINATGPPDAPAPAEPEPQAAARSFWEWLAGPSRKAEAAAAHRRAQHQALKAARARLGARRRWAVQQLEADRARQAWERRQDGFRAGLPHGLWGRANATWGSALLPWEIGAFGQLFMRDRLRIRDVRLYIRDLLKEYASLQKFKPKPNPLARCLDWERLLMEFEWPHYKEDKDVLLSFYPYLAGPFNYNCTGDPHEKGRVPYSPGHDAGDVWKESEEWQAAWRQKQEAAEQRQQQKQQKQAAKQQGQQEQQQQQQQQPDGDSASTAAAPGKGQKTDQKQNSKQQAPQKPAQQPGSKP